MSKFVYYQALLSSVWVQDADDQLLNDDIMKSGEYGRVLPCYIKINDGQL